MKKLLLVLGLVALVSAERPWPPPLCGCNPMYPPVCDKNGKKWPNLCELNCANHEPVEHDPEGKCLKTGIRVPKPKWRPGRPVLCGCRPDEPVCDTNGKQWPSLCHLNCRNHKPVKHDPEGKCLKKNKVEEPKWRPEHPVLCGCPPGEPVCDTNGKQWLSLCHLRCRDHEPVEHDPEGKCLK